MGRYLTDADLGDVTPAAAAAVAPAGRYLSDDQAGVAGAAPAKPAPLLDRLGRELGLGGRMILHGAGSMAGGWIVDPIVTAANGLGANIPTVQNSTDAWGDLLHLPRPATKSEQAADVIGSATTGAAGFGRILQRLGEAASRYAPNVGGALVTSGTTAAANPAATVGGAATSSAAGDAADQYAANHGFSPGARAATDLLGSMAGGLPGAAVASKLANGLPMWTRNGKLPGMAATPQQQQVIDAAGRAGVPLTAQDVGGPSGYWSALTKIAAKAPFGNVGPKATAIKQTDTIRDALNSTADQYTPAGLGTTYSNVDQLIAADLRSQYARAKTNVSAAFGNVETALAAHPGAEAISLPKTGAAAQQLLAEFPNVFDDLNTDASARKAVNSIITGMQPQNSPILQANGQPFQNPPTITYQDARALSRSLGQMLSQSQKRQVSGASNEAQTAMITRLYRSLNGDGLPGGGGDIGDWAAAAPRNISDAHYAALDAFRNQVLPFRNDSQMYRLVSSRTPQADYDLAAQGIYNNMFNPAQTERAPYALGLMSPGGQQAATYQALRNAADKGASNLSPGVGVSGGLRALNDNNDVLGSILANTPGAGQSAADMRTLLALGRHANDVLSDPKNGSRLQGLQSIGATAGGAFMLSHAMNADPFLVVPSAVAGAAGLGGAAHAFSRYLPKSLIFATPGSAVTNSVGPMFSLDQNVADPSAADPTDPATGLLMQ
ncbi:hypothetical protein P0D88_34995 [Paraburkholderia sp. RL18-103-BIB-C]|uniref:hypothetical protein n=1 Tax=Paraburkholderia sp. RL18-103-BIB-C TaxID=3031637 RepID=UPI0038BCF3D3